MKLGLGIALALAASMASFGCSTHRGFTYPLEPIGTINPNPPDIKIAVLPAQDLRGSKNRSATMSLGLIPLVPYGWVTYQRPESATMFNTIGSFDADPTEDIAKAVADHMMQSGYVKNAFFDYGGLRDTADYVMEIDLNEATYTGKKYYYGISFLAPYLWMIGLPAGSSTVDLQVTFRLEDKDERTVWSTAYTFSESFVQGFYYNWGRDMEPLALALQATIDAALRAHPIENLKRP